MSPPAPPHAGPDGRTSLRGALARLTLASLLPLAAAAAAVAWQSWQGQLAVTRETLLDTAAAMTLAVDRDVAVVRGQLHALGASRLIDTADWRELHRYMNAVAEERTGAVMALVDRDGRIVVQSNVAFSRELPNLWALEQRSLTTVWRGHTLPLSSQGLSRQVFETRAPAVSRMYVSLVARQPTLAIAIPVERAAEVRFALLYSFPTRSMEPLLDTRADSTLRLLLVDRAGVVIAGSRTAGDVAGTTIDTGTIAQVRESGARFVEETDRDGTRLLSAYAVSEVSGWTVKASQRRSEALSPAYLAAWTWGGVFVLVLVAALAASRVLARRLSAPLGALAEAARSGEAPVLPAGPTGIREVDLLAERLERASATERERRVELERRLASEARERAAAAAADVLRARERDLRIALDAGRMGTWHLDLATRTVRTDARHRMLWGIDGDDDTPVDSDVIRARVHPDDIPRMALSASPGPWADEFRVQHPDGGWRWLAGYGTVVRDVADRPVAMVGVNFDVTDRRRAEEALREDDRRKDEFIAVLAHELRNPLAPLRNALRLIGRDDPSPRTRDALGLCERQVVKLARLIDDLLDVARIKQGRIELRLERVDAGAAVAALVAAATPTFEAGGLRLRLTVPPAPALVVADPVRFGQIVENLLSNAAKFTDPGGEVRVSVAPQPDTVVVTVTDTGVGLAPDDLDRVFELFSQVPATADRTRDGLGIGLSLVRQLVTLHGGRVGASSGGPGCGSTFEVVLPRAPADVPSGPPAPAEPARAAVG